MIVPDSTNALLHNGTCRVIQCPVGLTYVSCSPYRVPIARLAAAQAAVKNAAKGLGGGLPIGACMLFEKTKDAFSYGDHGSTFGGNPVACAGAVSIVERLTKELFLEVRAKGDYLKTFISKMKGVEEVTGAVIFWRQ